MRRAGMVQRSRGCSRGGKCGGRAGKQRVLTWGDPKMECLALGLLIQLYGWGFALIS